MRGIRIAAMLALSLTSLSSADAQRANSLEAGFLTAFEDAAFSIGFRTTGVKQGGVGVDVGISTLPEGLAEGAVFLLTNLDLTTAIGIGPRAWLLPRAGVTVLAAFGDITGGAPGLNIGMGMLGRTGEKTGVRLDVTYMHFPDDEEPLGFTAITFGFAWIK